MTDFGDSLIESEQAEQDFKKLSMDLTETDEFSENISVKKQPTSEEMIQSTPVAPENVTTEYAHAKQQNKHIDEVSCRLYKVLYGYDVEVLNSDSEDVCASPSRPSIQTVRKDEDQGNAPNQTQSPGTQGFVTSDASLKTASFISSDLEAIAPVSLPKVSHDSSQKYDDIPAVTAIECGAPGYESIPEIVSDLQSSSLTQSRASSPESVSSLNELDFLIPDFPVPQFRPLSPLPPPVIPWEPSDVRTLPHGQLLVDEETEERPLTPMVSNRRPFGRPVSPGSDDSGTRAISPQSLSFDIEDRASSPESVILEMDQFSARDLDEMRLPSPDPTVSISARCQLPPNSQFPYECRSSSPESVSSHMAFEITEHRPASPESTTSVNEYMALPPDSPVTEFTFNWPDSAFLTGGRSSSSESACSDVDYGSLSRTSFYHEDRALSPSSITSGDESEFLLALGGHKTISPELVKSSNIVFESKPTDGKPSSLECDSQMKSTAVELIPESYDDWVFISLSDVDERPLSPDSVPDYRPMSPQSAMLDIRRYSVDSDPLHECGSPDSPIPQYMSSTHHYVHLNYHSSSESELSDTEYEAMPLLSYFEIRPSSPESCGSVSGLGFYFNSETELPLDKDVALELTQGTNLIEGAFAEVLEITQVTADLENFTKDERCIKGGPVDNQPITPQTSSEDPGNSQSDKNTVSFLTGEVLQTNEIPKELSHSLMEDCSPQSDKTLFDSKKILKKIGKRHGSFKSKPFQQTKKSDDILSPSLSPEPTSKDQHVFLPSSSGVPISQTLPEEFFSSPAQYHIPLSVAEHSQPADNLIYDAELWKLMSQIRDPQYVGETFRSKVGTFQLLGKSAEETTEDDSTAVLFEMSQGSLSLDSECRPVSLQSALFLDTLRPDSPLSGRYAVSQPALTPESLIPQYLPSFLETNNPYLQSLSPVSDGNSSIFSAERPSSPDSVSSVNRNKKLSPDSPIPAFGRFLPEDVTCVMVDWSSSFESLSSSIGNDSVSLASLFNESRPPSISSVDENQPLSPDSPIPDFGPVLLDFNVSTKTERSSTPLSFTSETEYESLSVASLYGESRPPSVSSVDENNLLPPDSPIPEFGPVFREAYSVTLDSSSPVSFLSDTEPRYSSLSMCSEVRPSSPNSVLSGDNYRCYSPIPELKSGLTESMDITEHRLSCPDSDVFDSDYAQSTENKSVSQHRLDLPELQVCETTDRLLDASNPESLRTIRVPVYKLIYDAELWKLISHIRDPHYVGETFSSKTGFFSCAGTRIEHIIGDPSLKERNSGDGVNQNSQVKEKVKEGRESLDSISLDFKDQRPVESIVSSLENTQTEAHLTFRTNQMICQLYDPHYVGDVSFRKEFDDMETLLPEARQSLNVPMFDSQGKENSLDETKSLSSDSSIPQLSVSLLDSSLGHHSLTSSEHVSESEPLFTSRVVERFPSFVGFWSTHPESSSSDIEYAPVINLSSNSESRPNNQESSEPKLGRRPFTSDSESDIGAISPVSQPLTIGPSLPESTGSPKRLAVSSDSPVAEFIEVRQDSDTEHRSFLSQSSDLDMEMGCVIMPCEDRRSSPDSASERHSLDSPVPDFSQAVPALCVDPSGCRSSSSNSTESDIGLFPLISQWFEVKVEDRPDSPQSKSSWYEYSLSPDSPIPQYTYSETTTFIFRAASPKSVFSDEDSETDLCMPWLFEDRAVSPDSTAYKEEFRPDSPIPDFTFESLACQIQLRSTSPESQFTDEDSESDLCMPWLFEDRAVSPDSTTSKDELRPDSPIPDFTFESLVCQIQRRSTSPESQFSEEDSETDLCMPWLFEDRAVSPDSTTSKDEFRPDSPIPDFAFELLVCQTQLRSTSPESQFSGEDLETDLCIPWLFEDRAVSPGSTTSKDELRPDSPIPDFTFESLACQTQLRSTSPESQFSNEDLETDLCIPWLFEDRAVSPGSTTSIDELKLLSPDSPIPEFTQGLQEFTILPFRSRSISPESVYSDEDLETELCMPWLFEDRAISPDSTSSKYELRPDSPIPDFTFESLACQIQLRSTSPESQFTDEDSESDLCMPWLFEDRAVSPDSTTSKDELRPDSPIPDFTFESLVCQIQLRSTSPESQFSDEDSETDLCMPWLFEDRAVSPDSTTSKDEFRPDSPIPDFAFELLVCQTQLRSTSPESQFSGEDLETDLCIPWLFEDRAVSPGSTTSKDELRPDSPIPDFTFESLACQTQLRSTSPESQFSNEDLETDLCIPWLFEDRAVSPGSTTSIDELKLLSPDSPIPEFTQGLQEFTILPFRSRSISPESVYSDEDLETELCMPWLFEDRAISPDSTSSKYELRPDSPIPDFTFESLACQIQLRSTSPESQFTDEDSESDLCMPWLFEDRAVSPDSTTSKDELRPDSPIPDFTFESLVCQIQRRSTSPESQFSDEDSETDLCMPWLFEYRAVSPGSTTSIDELKLLSPDSPIPEFTQGLQRSTILPFRSTSPESFLSDEFSDLEADLPFTFSESRPSSPESLSSKRLSPESPLPDFVESMPVLNETFFELRSTSPESACSDTEYIVLSLGSLFYDNRRSSPGSEASGDEYQALSPDSPIPEYRAAAPERVIINIGYRSPSPQSIGSDVEEALSEFLMSLRFGIEDRPSSPESVESELQARPVSPESARCFDENKRLSPDSPLPWFAQNVTATTKRYNDNEFKSAHPASFDLEYVLPYFESELRPLPLESTLSEDQNESGRSLSAESLTEYMPMPFESVRYMPHKRASSPESMPELNENRSLSPDSPIPHFTPPLEEYPAIHKSSSTESFDSDSDYELVVIASKIADTSRPSSPESLSSVNEFQQLLPDSPVPEFMRILSSYFMNTDTFDRSSSPVSFSSDSEFVALPIDCWIDDSPRPISPESVELEPELDLFYDEIDELASPLLNQSSPLSETKSTTVSPLPIQTIEGTFASIGTTWQQIKESPSDAFSHKLYKERYSDGLEAESICEEDFREDLSTKPSPDKDVNRRENKIHHISSGELKSKADDHRAHPPQTNLHKSSEVQNKLVSAVASEDDSNAGKWFSDDKTKMLLPIQIPDQSSYTTHRTVSPVLPDHDPIFSENSPASLDNLSHISPAFSYAKTAESEMQGTIKRESETVGDIEFSPDFKRVISDFETAPTESESQEPKSPLKEPRNLSPESSQPSDSDLEFFDCRQDLSEPDDVRSEHEIAYNICEPPSPIPSRIPDTDLMKGSPQHRTRPFLWVEHRKHVSSGSESPGEFIYDSESSKECPTEVPPPLCEELPSRDQAEYYDDDDFLGREIAEELGQLSSDSSEEEVLTTRVVRRRVIIQADNLPDIPPQTVTEEKYTDEHGNLVVKKITRKVIRKYVSPDGLETQEVTIEGSHQETVQIEEGDSISRVVKRTVLHSEGDQKELTFSEPPALDAATSSQFEVEAVQGRKVSKVVKTKVVRGERMEKQTGDPSLAADRPSAREDFEKKSDA
ncbi:ankyrin-2b isoform 12-T12 [Menidia menidia]